MSLASIAYDVKDFLTKTEAEKNYEKYKETLEDLQDNLKKIEKNLTNLADQIVELNKLKKPISVSAGKYVTDFDVKCQEILKQISDKFIYYCEKRTQVNNLLSSVEEKYEAWQNAVNTENSRKRNLSKEELEAI